MLALFITISCHADFFTFTNHRIEGRLVELRRFYLSPNSKNVSAQLRSKFDFYIHKIMLTDNNNIYPKENILKKLSTYKGDLLYFNGCVKLILLHGSESERHSAMFFLFQTDLDKSLSIFYACIPDKSDYVSLDAARAISYYGSNNDLFLLTVIANNLKDSNSVRAKCLRSDISEMTKRLETKSKME